MKPPTQILYELWLEAGTRFSKQLATMEPDDLKKKLSPSPNSAGFLIRHIGDVELLFAKNVFGASEIRVAAKTVIAQKDTGEWTDLADLTQYSNYAFESLKEIILQQKQEDWESMITTKEFGTKTKAEAMGRIVSHTAYHAGQLAIVVKYGKQIH